MAEFTPTTEQIRDGFTLGDNEIAKRRGEAFDRWLAENNRKVADRALGQDSTGHPLRTEYGFVTLSESTIAPYTTYEDARLIGGGASRIVQREVGPWLPAEAPNDALPLDPEPWLVPEAPCGNPVWTRSAHREPGGFDKFDPRPGYEKDRAKYSAEPSRAGGES